MIAVAQLVGRTPVGLGGSFLPWFSCYKDGDGDDDTWEAYMALFG